MSHPPSFPFAREDTFHPPSINAKLRHECPVSKAKLYNDEEAWVVFKHKDICEALSTPNLSADRRTPGYPEIHKGGHNAKDSHPTFVNLDDPEHREQRQMLEDAFLPEAVAGYRPTIHQTVDEALDNLESKLKQSDGQPVDLINEFAMPVPTKIVYKLLGVPDNDVEELSKDSKVRTGTSRDAAESSNTNLHDYMSNLVDQRIKEPKQDLISKLVKEQYGQTTGKLSKDDIISLAFLVLIAGNAALINSIGLGVLTLLNHPGQLEVLKKDPSIAPQVVNELLRYSTASALNSRRAAKEDTEIGGQKIKKGEGVICSVQSGDRDEDKTEEPEKFNIHRRYDQKDVLGFGYGPHRCQGEALSRAELEVAFSKLFQRLPSLKLAVSEDDLKYTPPTQNIGVQELPVILG